MGQTHGAHKVGLKIICHRGLDALGLGDGRRDLETRVTIQQRHTSAGPCGIACRGNLFQIAVGDEPQYHGVAHADMTAEGAGKTNPVHRGDTHLIHQ